MECQGMVGVLSFMLFILEPMSEWLPACFLVIYKMGKYLEISTKLVCKACVKLPETSPYMETLMFMWDPP